MMQFLGILNVWPLNPATSSWAKAKFISFLIVHSCNTICKSNLFSFLVRGNNCTQGPKKYIFTMVRGMCA